MNHFFTVLLLTVVGALIGWITNIFAIKLLFRPIKPIKIPLTRFTIVGLIPKRKKEIAKNIGEVVANELISIRELMDEAVTEEDLTQIRFFVKRKIKAVIDEKLNIIPFPFKGMIQGPLDELIETEVNNGLTDIIVNIKDMIELRVNIAKIVEDNIMALDLRELERIILQVAKKELKHIEILGFILGGVIGLVQGIILMYL
ncbi:MULTISPECIES: DUF445 domain-containing protein [Turicibacter]|jgi:hypothetical protein|uniref:DUF445 family protein n=3 Tax=Turicibacter sanguinis TaxID=154288 RepID=A0A173SNB5_9FIRM|nr:MULTISPECIES: DUF445 family protein [Turicibacter]EFF62844.1 conserved hypothetical protein [Turicibacter sanguinis PC909]MBP3905205.1 DUF445 family protein [Turicibacter sp.]MCU7190178.1 DUF445 family protein [Turicibacter sanguinis]MCU7196073.1 DUF445 family protein [Turicibacter sanguinis]MCU7202420.1 DUF445 family protein [Turicibacter sanguinis]